MTLCSSEAQEGFILSSRQFDGFAGLPQQHLPIHDNIPLGARGGVHGGRGPAVVQHQLDVGVSPVHNPRLQVDRLAEVSYHRVLLVPIRL